ncbi:MAG TPA: AGE family epimerase/isomerase [Marinilabiliaceae bacterium]|nr:AGE family epimerase/isomerase [Marinilabiliaceae bacterium]
MKVNRASLREDLLVEYKNILQYWMDHTIDREDGGFLGEVDHLGQSIKEAPKGVVLNTRILWTFSSAYNFLKNERYLEIAHRAYEYLIKHFWDKEFGGVFWSLTYDGQILESRKQVYAQGFAIYGLSEYYRATKKQEALDYSIDLFRLIEKYSFDEKHNGYLEAFTREWKPLEDMRLSAKDANSPKTMNTHLHIIEPYSNLYRVWSDELLAKKMKNLVELFLDKIIHPKTGHLHLFFDLDWTVQSNIVSYGHDIEGAWLLCEAAELLADEELLKRVEAAAILIADVTIKEGVASDHSVLYEKDLTSNELDADRHWWVQAEAMVGFTQAWQISGDEDYLKKMDATWKYIQQNVIDQEYGEWHLRISPEGSPIASDGKAGFWKCPYHNTRALMEVYSRIK